MGQSGKSAAFAFKRRSEQINWKKLAAIDVNKITEELDFQTLQDNITNVTFCQIENEIDAKSLDLNYIKLFKIAQLTIEYLLHSQDYLANVIQSLETKCQQLEDQLAQERKQKEKLLANIQELKKENKRRKKMLLEQQQHYMTAANTSYKCTNCPKAFISTAYLDEHLRRRHPESASPSAIPFKQDQQQASPVLTQELEDIHKRLKETESLLAEERNFVNQMRSKVNVAVREDEIWKNLEEWKKGQAEKSKQELETVSTLFMKELKQLQEVHLNSLQQMQRSTDCIENRTATVVPELGDRVREAVHKEKEDIQNLRVQLLDQMEEMESHIQKKLKHQEKEWTNKVKHLTDVHATEVQRFESALVESRNLLEKERKEKGKEQKKLKKLAKRLTEQSSKQHRRHSFSDRERDSPSPVESEIETFPPTRIATSRPSSSVHSSERSHSPKVVQVETIYKNDPLPKSPALERRVSTSAKEKLREAMGGNPDLLDGLREELHGLLQDKMKQWSISDCDGLSNNVYKRKLSVVEGARKRLAEKYKNFHSIKARLESTLNEKVSAAMTRFTPKRGTLYGTKNKPLMEPDLKPTSKPSTPVKKLTFTKPEMQILGSKQTNDKSSSEELSSESDEDESDDEDIRPIANHPPIVQDIQPIDSSTPIKPMRTAKTGKDTESSNRDEEDNSDDERARPRLQEPIKRKQPAGKKVAALASSIEQQLTRRKEIKPPAGSVDIMRTTTTDQFSKKSQMYGGTSSLSSLEDLTSPQKQNQMASGDANLKTGLVAYHNGTSKNKINNPPSKKNRKMSWDSDVSIEELT